jgi:hypothetical protein
MKLAENFHHQMAMLGNFTLREARANLNVDVTGWTLLDDPIVTVHRNGTITVQIATLVGPTPEPIDEPVEEVPAEAEPPVEVA